LQKKVVKFLLCIFILTLHGFIFSRVIADAVRQKNIFVVYYYWINRQIY